MRRGFSLIETLVTFFLVSLVLALVASIAREYGQMVRSGDRSGASQQARQLVLRTLRAELEGATRVLSPTGGPNPVLEFETYGAVAGRLPDPPDPPPPTWDPRDPTHLITVRYSLVGGELIRDVGGTQQVVAQDLAGFSAQVLADQTLEMTLSYELSGRLLQVRGVVGKAVF